MSTTLNPLAAQIEAKVQEVTPSILATVQAKHPEFTGAQITNMSSTNNVIIFLDLRTNTETGVASAVFITPAEMKLPAADVLARADEQLTFLQPGIMREIERSKGDAQ